MGGKLCILNYGSGNVGSVFNMLSTITDGAVVSNQPADLVSSTHIILPGVGAFGSAMKKIRKAIPLDILEEEVLRKGKPFLGICVGMQVLADRGFEFGEHKGLGWISGTVEKMKSGSFSLPHVGWNNIEISKQVKLFDGLPDNQDFYFVHSYIFKERNPSDAAARTDYGEKFTSVVARDNIFGVQFHPEKSQKAGRIILKNFIEIK